MERINKYLAGVGIGSRRGVEQLIKDGLVLINGQKATLSSNVSELDIVKVKDKIVNKKNNIYIALNKPKGVVTTKKDPYAAKTIIELLPSNLSHLFPVGRLDKNTRGLIILTNDGNLSHKLTHPKFEKEKEYEVTVNKKANDVQTKQLLEGVLLDDGLAKAKKLTKIDDKNFVIIISEGRKRQVRRMFEKIDLKVIDLKRTRIYNLNINDLKEGGWRYLTEKEVTNLAR
jgi:23S rRNA pseudouridine2605 synthase